MSKSDPSEQSRINLSDDADAIALKIRRAKTDPQPLPSEVEGLENRPEARNLVGIYAALTDTDLAAVLREHGGKGFGAFKEVLTELLVAKLAPIAAQTERLLADPGTIEAILRDGARRAEVLATPIAEEAERLVGFLKA
jgi:tryptophanyl-tRNA synthetase